MWQIAMHCYAALSKLQRARLVVLYAAVISAVGIFFLVQHFKKDEFAYLQDSVDTSPLLWGVLQPHASAPIPAARHHSRPSTAEMATALSPRELLDRPRSLNSKEHQGIPKFFHQSWKSTAIPADFERWSQTCRRVHAGWEWILWTEDDDLALIKARYPGLEEVYRQLPDAEYKSGLMRSLYMHSFGGVYADLDTECLHPASVLFNDYNVKQANNDLNRNATATSLHSPVAILSRVGSDADFEQFLPTAWIASTPNHPFFIVPVEAIKRTVKQSQGFFGQWFHKLPSAESLVGSNALRRHLVIYSKFPSMFAEKVLLLPHAWVYPFDWNADDNAVQSTCTAEEYTFNSTTCKNSLEVSTTGSISISYGSYIKRLMTLDKDERLSKMRLRRGNEKPRPRDQGAVQ